MWRHEMEMGWGKGRSWILVLACTNDIIILTNISVSTCRLLALSLTLLASSASMSDS